MVGILTGKVRTNPRSQVFSENFGNRLKNSLCFSPPGRDAYSEGASTSADDFLPSFCDPASRVGSCQEDRMFDREIWFACLPLDTRHEAVFD